MKLWNKTKLTVASCAILIALCSFQPAESAELKIGTVNFKTCVENSKQGKQEQANFESLKKKMEEALSGKEKELSAIAKKFNDPDYLDTLSPEAEAEMKHKFRALNQELNQNQNQYYQALQQANFKIIQSVNTSISKASETIAKAKGYDLILNQEGSFFSNAKLDVSNQIIAEMDKMFEQESN